MARLGPDSPWLIQQIGGTVRLYHEGTNEEIVAFNPGDANATARAQLPIHQSEHLDDEQKTFAHFWSGYFHAHATKS